MKILLEKATKGKGQMSTVLRNGHSTIGFLFWQKEAIQGHVGGIAFDPELQDNVLLPKGFTKYTNHVGNVSEVHSII